MGGESLTVQAARGCLQVVDNLLKTLSDERFSTQGYFIKKRDTDTLYYLPPFSERTQIDQEVKYLDITLDAKLTWNAH